MFCAIFIMLVVSACLTVPPVSLPFQVTSTETPTNTSTNTATSQPTPTEIPTDTATPQPTPTEVPTSTAMPPISKKVYKSIPYKQVNGVDPNLLSLDIYTPASAGAHPVIVMIHGGSWSGGDKDTLVVSGTKSEFFTNKGFVFVSINYQLAPKAIYPRPELNVAAALAWITLHISDYGGNAGQLYVMGHSAGAQLAALVATDAGFLAYFKLKPSILSGVILLDAAGLDIPATMSNSLKFMYTTAFGENPNTWAAASPVNHVAANQGIPLFLVCYTFQVAPFALTSEEFAGKLEAAGVKVWDHAALDKTHDSINDDVGTLYDPVTERIMLFLEETLPKTKLGPVAWGNGE